MKTSGLVTKVKHTAITLNSIKVICCCLSIIAASLVINTNCFAESYAYVPKSSQDTLSVIRTSDNVIVATIETGDEPYGTAVTPNGNYAFVTNRGDGTVSVINTSENLVVSTLTVGSEPAGVATGPDNLYAYVCNQGSNTVSIIGIDDDDNNTVVATVTVGNSPTGVAVDQVDGDAYVTNSGDGTVSVIRTDDDTLTLNVGSNPIGITIDQDGDYAYVANSGDNTVSVIQVNDDTNTVIDTVPVGGAPWGVAVIGDADEIFVSNSEDNTVSVIDASGRQVEATLAVGEMPLGIAGPKNGDYIYVLNSLDDTISRIELTDLSISVFDIASGAAPMGLGAFIGGTPPAEPSDLTAEMTSSDQITLSWSDNSYDETGFKIERRLYYDDDSEYSQCAVVDANTTSYTDGGLSSVTTYEYRIRAYNEVSDSDYSDSAYAQTDEEDADSVNCFISSAAASPANRPAFGLLLTLIIAFYLVNRRFSNRKGQR